LLLLLIKGDLKMLNVNNQNSEFGSTIDNSSPINGSKIIQKSKRAQDVQIPASDELALSSAVKRKE
jgi:hypothetical protein